MHKALPHSQPAGVSGGVGKPPTTAHRAGAGFRQRVREFVRDDVRLFQVAAAVIAIAVADDAFIHPEPGTSARDHLASGLIPIAIAVAGALAYPRLRAGLRACIALVFGALALEAGIVDGVRHAVLSGISGDDVTAILAALAGAGLVILATATLWRTRRLNEPHLRRYARRSVELVLAAIVGVLVIVPTGMAILATHVARAPVPAAQLGSTYRSVTFTASDGLKLAGWYVPSRNGAAIILSPGRSPSVQAHARMLIQHGYGVLLFDRRGEGQSQGDRNMYGWSGDKDLLGAVTFLQRQPDVHQGLIGGLGLSVGGEMLLQAGGPSRSGSPRGSCRPARSM